jgi:lipoprotein-anchoring transpeptidase ErfK/SrfK
MERVRDAAAARIAAGALLGLVLGLTLALLAPHAAQAVAPPTRARAWTARLVVPTPALTHPGRGRTVMRLGVAARWAGGPQTLLVLAVRRDAHGARWLRVTLPRRARRRSAWISADAAVLAPTAWRIEVSLRRRRLTVLHDGHLWRRFRGVVGAPGTPTPTGVFAVAERVRQADPAGFYGGWILFLTAYSDAVRWFDGNAGQVGIHGRGGASLRDPLGTARSHGCVRLSNRAVALVAGHVPEGAPVVIAH